MAEKDPESGENLGIALFEVAEGDVVGDEVVWVIAVVAVVAGAVPVLEVVCTTQPVPEIEVGATDIVTMKLEGTLTSGHLFAQLTNESSVVSPQAERAQFVTQLYSIHGKYGAGPITGGKSGLRPVMPVKLKVLETNPGP